MSGAAESFRGAPVANCRSQKNSLTEFGGRQDHRASAAAAEDRSHLFHRANDPESTVCAIAVRDEPFG